MRSDKGDSFPRREEWNAPAAVYSLSARRFLKGYGLQDLCTRAGYRWCLGCVAVLELGLVQCLIVSSVRTRSCEFFFFLPIFKHFVFDE